MAMSKPLILVETSDVHPESVGDLLSALSDLASFVRAAEPRVIAFQAYLSDDGTRLTLVEIHPDSTSVEFHLNAAGAALPRLARLMTMTGLDVYGEPSVEVLERLRDKAVTLGADALAVHVHSAEAGFERLPTGSLLRPNLPQRHSMAAAAA